MMVAIPPSRAPLLRPLGRALAFGLILVLLAVRLGTLTEEVLVTPIEAAIFGVAFIVDAEKDLPFKLLANKVKCQFDRVVPQGQSPLCALLPARTLKLEHIPVFLPRDLVADIFIPPEGVA